MGKCEGADLASELPAMSTSLLNELDGGAYCGMSAEKIKAKYPSVYEAREHDKLRFRYPGTNGESYLDVIRRLAPIVTELERQRRSVLIISHLAVQRCIFGYFMGTSTEQIPYLALQQHAVIELRPGPYGCESETHDLSHTCDGE